MVKRNLKFDILRAVAIILIFLAHASPPGIIFQFRNFDVILLMLLSGFFSKHSLENNKNIFLYYKKRILRFIIPVWIFLFIYFIISKIVLNIDFDINEIISAFLLGDDFGYIWIFKVYIITCLISPILYYVYKKIIYKKYLLFLSCLLILNQIGIWLIGTNNELINWILFYTIGYGACYGLGFVIDNLKKKDYYYIIFINFIIFLFLMIYYYKVLGRFVTTNMFKYPPGFYYISYGVFVAFIFLFILNYFNVKFPKFLSNYFSFIGSHSMWIYLWHIPIVKILNYYNFDYWILSFILILILSSCFMFLQSFLVKKTNNKNIIKYFDC